jgi:hypothetical protein
MPNTRARGRRRGARCFCRSGAKEPRFTKLPSCSIGGTRPCTESWQRRVASNHLRGVGHPERSAWPNEREIRERRWSTRSAVRSIAARLKRSPLTISREFERNGGRNSQIATLVERQTRYLMLVRLTGKDTETVANALIRHGRAAVRRTPAPLSAAAVSRHSPPRHRSASTR